jgi:hypothetical protein
MAVPAPPWSFTQIDVADVFQIEAAPLAVPRQRRSRLPAELKGKELLLSVLVPKDLRTNLAIVTAVHAGHLLALQDGAMEQLEGGAVLAHGTHASKL